MARVGPAAPTHDLQRGQPLLQRAVRRHEDAQIALVQLLGLVQLGMARGRGVAAQPRHPLHPRTAVVEGRDHVLRVGAVDQEVRRRRDGVDLLDRRLQGGAVGQPPVGLDREADADREPERVGRAHHADRLAGVGQGQRTHGLGARLGERPHLGRVVVGRLVGVDRVARGVPVAARPDHPGHHDVGHPVAPLVRHPLQQLDSGPVRVGDRAYVVPEQGRPVRVRPPGRALEAEPGTDRTGDVGVPVVVGAEQGPALVGPHQRVRRELRQVHAVVEDQVGLQTAVGDVAPVRRRVHVTTSASVRDARKPLRHGPRRAASPAAGHHSPGVHTE